MPEIVPTYVVDASVAVKWLLQTDEEEDLEKAAEVQRDYSDGRINLVAPSILPYEIGQALVRAVRRNRVDADTSEGLFEQFLNWEIPLVGDHSLLQAARRSAFTYGGSFYDNTYMALARRLSCRVICADDKLRETLTNHILGSRRNAPQSAGSSQAIEGYAEAAIASVIVWLADYLPEVRLS
jgi:predicted nucleic acid-binding protein